MESEKKENLLNLLNYLLKENLLRLNLIEIRNWTVRDKVRNDAKIINDVCWHVITLTYYPSAYI